MPNRLAQFSGNVPPPKVRLYWDEKAKQWEVWFGEDAPMYEDGEFNPFTAKLYEYAAVRK